MTHPQFTLSMVEGRGWSPGLITKLIGDSDDDHYKEAPADAETLEMSQDESDLRFGPLNAKEFKQELAKHLEEIKRLRENVRSCR